MDVYDSMSYYPIEYEPSDLLARATLAPPPFEFRNQDYLEKSYRVLLEKVKGLEGLELKLLNSRLGAVCYQLGLLYYDAECVPISAEPKFVKALSFINDQKSHVNNVLTAINSLNMLAFISIKHTKDYKKALELLLQAEEIYNTYREINGDASVPTPVHVLLECQENQKIPPTGDNPLIHARLYTLIYVIKVYTELEMYVDALVSTHHMLKLQRENNFFIQSFLDFLDWAFISAAAAVMFSKLNAFKQAKNHLLAASKFIDDIIPIKYSDIYKSTMYEKRFSDIAYCWSKYGLLLLQASEKHLCHGKELEKPLAVFDDLLFEAHDATESDNYLVTSDYVLSYNDAQELAQFIHKMLKRAQKYYTFEKSAFFYSCTCMDKTKTYKILSLIQQETVVSAALLKKGTIDLKKVAEKFNNENSLNVTKQIFFELGTIYSLIMGIKFHWYIFIQQDLSDKAIDKINPYADLTVIFYTKFIESLYQENKLPKRLEKDFAMQLLTAYLTMAKCMDRKIVRQKYKRLENLLQCQQYYKAFLDYCKNDPRVKEFAPTQLQMCKDLMQAIPSRIETVKKYAKGP